MITAAVEQTGADTAAGFAAPGGSTTVTDVPSTL